MNDNLKERIDWTRTPFNDGQTYKLVKKDGKTANQQREEAKNKEKQWGNSMINDTNNGQWTTKLGENLVKDVLERTGRTVSRPKKKEHYQPDWETEDAIWEVKTRNWTVTGTAGEKVFGTMYKYSDVPLLYGKPLIIVCVAYQEYELTHGNTKIFGEMSDRKKAFLKLAEDFKITYMKFSELVSQIPN